MYFIIILPLVAQIFIVFFFDFLLTVTADVRVKRQDDDDEQNIEELCQDRPADEYFRLADNGDCRDVVR